MFVGSVFLLQLSYRSTKEYADTLFWTSFIMSFGAIAATFLSVHVSYYLYLGMRYDDREKDERFIGFLLTLLLSGLSALVIPFIFWSIRNLVFYQKPMDPSSDDSHGTIPIVNSGLKNDDSGRNEEDVTSNK